MLIAAAGLSLASVSDALIYVGLQRTIELNKILGNNFLIVAMDKDRMATRKGILELAGILNDVADKLKIADNTVDRRSGAGRSRRPRTERSTWK